MLSAGFGNFGLFMPVSPDEVPNDPGSGHHAQLRYHEKEQTHEPRLL